MVKSVCVSACLQATPLPFPYSLLCPGFTSLLSELLRKAREVIPEEAASVRTGKVGTEKKLP